MKKIRGLLLLIPFFGITFATVGGPTLVGNLYYDKGGNNIWYSKTFYDGLGGSEIHKYSIENQKDIRINKLEELEFEEGRLMSETSNLEKYFQENRFTPLKEFQLNKIPVRISLTLKYFNELTNNESFEIAEVVPHPFVEDSEGYMMSGYIFNFIWDNKIFIGNQLKSQGEISTCRLNPINYRGFGVSTIDTIIIITTVEKKDCMEGGYLGEDIHILSGVRINEKFFLEQNSTGFDTNNYYETRKIEPSTGGLRIEPNMTGSNEVQGTQVEEIQNINGFFQKIQNYIKKIIGYFSF